MTRRLASLVASFGLLVGLAAALAVTAPATLAYQGCATSASAGANPTAADPNAPVDFTVTFRDCNGQAINAAVTFSQQSGPAGCSATFNPTTAHTDANGTAHTTVTLPAGCPCQYTLAATANGVTVTTTVRENGCLPFTGAARLAGAGSGPNPLPLVLVVVGGVLAVSALLLYRRSAR